MMQYEHCLWFVKHLSKNKHYRLYDGDQQYKNEWI